MPSLFPLVPATPATTLAALGDSCGALVASAASVDLASPTEALFRTVVALVALESHVTA